MIAYLARLGDSYVRQPETVPELVQDRTPLRGGAAGLGPALGVPALPAKQDALGRPVQNEAAGPVAGAFPFPRRTAEKEDPVLDAFAAAKVNIGEPKQQLTIDGIKIQLKPDEQRAWQSLRGDVLQQAVPKLIGKPALEKDGERVLKSILDDASEVADERLKAQIGGEELRRRIREATARKAS
jgi:hypothetical protein